MVLECRSYSHSGVAKFEHTSGSSSIMNNSSTHLDAARFDFQGGVIEYLLRTTVLEERPVDYSHDHKYVRPLR